MSNIKRYAPYATVAVLGVILLNVASKQASKLMPKMMGSEGGPMGM